MNPDPIGVIIPVYNEEKWIEKAVSSLYAALAEADLKADVVIVDDGSTDSSPDILDKLATKYRCRVVHQANVGRLAARRAGLEVLKNEFVLLLDARVFLKAGAFVPIKEEILAGRQPAYNGDIEVLLSGSILSGFWSGLTKLGWCRYFYRQERKTIDGTNFDYLPKGTGLFFAPRRLLLEANRQFSSLYGEASKIVSDDTGLLRYIAETHSYVIDPAFAAFYEPGRTNFKSWCSQVFYRGTTFVDSYFQSNRRLYGLLAAILGGAGLGISLAKCPKTRKLLLVGGISLPASLAGGVAITRGNKLEIESAATLFYPFSIVFFAGIVRGIWMALKEKVCSKTS